MILRIVLFLIGLAILGVTLTVWGYAILLTGLSQADMPLVAFAVTGLAVAGFFVSPTAVAIWFMGLRNLPSARPRVVSLVAIWSSVAISLLLIRHLIGPRPVWDNTLGLYFNVFAVSATIGSLLILLVPRARARA